MASLTGFSQFIRFIRNAGSGINLSYRHALGLPPSWTPEKEYDKGCEPRLEEIQQHLRNAKCKLFRRKLEDSLRLTSLDIRSAVANSSEIMSNSLTQEPIKT